jgi:adenosylcobinamide kinase/adenosylcobinamide-phosphate guanylyltransferase
MSSKFVLIGGGARSGKSAFALQLALAQGERRVFVATAEAFDDEMRQRIAAHAAERGAQFATVEAPLELESALAELCSRAAEIDVVVIDCLTLWLSNLLLAGLSAERIEARVEALAQLVSAAPLPVLLVSNEVGMGLVPETPLGRVFRDVTGRAHQRLARAAGSIYLATLGCIVRLKPAPITLLEAEPTLPLGAP